MHTALAGAGCAAGIVFNAVIVNHRPVITPDSELSTFFDGMTHVFRRNTLWRLATADRDEDRSVVDSESKAWFFSTQPYISISTSCMILSAGLETSRPELSSPNAAFSIELFIDQLSSMNTTFVRHDSLGRWGTAQHFELSDPRMKANCWSCELEQLNPEILIA